MSQSIDLFRSSPVLRGILLVFALFLVLLVVDWRYRRLPYYWDSLGYVQPHATEIYLSNLFPILRNWDVGHPTAFYFTLAAGMKVFGTGPLAGHVLVWWFTALLGIALYGLGRVLRLPHGPSATGALVVLVFPLVWAMSLQILIDLPLLAVTMAAYWFWARERKWGYLALAGYGVLMKLHGILLISGPVGAVLFSHGAFWRRERRRDFLRDLAWSSSPIVVLLAFLIVRYLVRGPGLTIGWVSAIKPVPIWHPRMFAAHIPRAWYTLFAVSLTNEVLYVCVGIWMIVGLRFSLKWGKGNPGESVWESKPQRRLVLALVFLGLTTAAAFFQSEAQCVRYILPTTAALFLLGNLGLWQLLRKPVPMFIIHGLAAFCFIVLWHPKYGARLPSPLSDWLTRSPVAKSWLFESDLRFLDVIRQMRWAANKVEKDAANRGLDLSVGTQWPMTISYWAADIGVVERPIPNVTINSWKDLDNHEVPYVVIVWPISTFRGPPPSNRFRWENVAVHKRSEITVEIWYIERKESVQEP